jgi:hypothetical protein
LNVEVGQLLNGLHEFVVLAQSAANGSSFGLADIDLALALLAVQRQVGARAMSAALMANAPAARAGAESLHVRTVQQQRKSRQFLQQRPAFPA